MWVTNGPITMNVPDREVEFYLRAGYEVVKEKPKKWAKTETVEKPEKPPEKAEE